MAYEPEDDGLVETLWHLYAASRVRDTLLLAHQPVPGDDTVSELDQALGRQQQEWPALMIGELVFTRAGVHVRAGSAHAVPGVADRSTLHWEYWRRHRVTSDGSFWWGHNSQWRTAPRRDYKNRCQLRVGNEPDFPYLDVGIDEGHH